ncbi:MAG: glycosyltransferase family 4 protein [Gemmatimonadota bacterium]
MRILTVCYEYPPLGGGGAPACAGLCEALVAAGHEVDVVTSAMDDLPAREEIRGVDVHRTWCRRRRMHLTTPAELLTGLGPALRKALELTRKRRYHLSHCHFVVPSGLVSQQLHARTGLPYILTAHGSDVPGYNPDRFGIAHRLIRPLWRRIIRSGRAVVTPSLFLRDLIQDYIDVDAKVIPYGFTPPPSPPGQERGNRILCVTRMFERKGVQHLIRAFADLGAEGWELQVAGDGPYLPQARLLAERLGVGVTFLGQVERHALPALYQSAKVFVLPSKRDNFPVVLLEALSAGCAIVTTTGSGCAEVVADSGILVDPDSVEGLREALERLVGQESLIADLRSRSLERVQRFAWPRIAAEHEAVYRAALDGAGSGSGR